MNSRGPVTCSIQARVSPDTHALVTRSARRAGISRAEYLERLVLAEASRELIPRTDTDAPQRGEVGRATMALFAHVSPAAHALVKSAAADCGLSVSLYIERAALADAEHRLVKGANVEQPSLEVAV